MNRVRVTWLMYGLCALVVAGGLGWLSWHTLELERREAQAVAEARQQELVRLALWRMESALAPMLARESARPYFEYRSFYPADRAYSNMMNEFVPGEVVVPSPLLPGSEPPILLHFELLEDRRIVSPQVPESTSALAKDTYVSGYKIDASRLLLSQLIPMVGQIGVSVPERREVQLTDQATQSQVQREGVTDAMAPAAEALEGSRQSELAASPNRWASQQNQIQQNVQEYNERARTQQRFNKGSKATDGDAVIAQEEALKWVPPDASGKQEQSPANPAASRAMAGVPALDKSKRLEEVMGLLDLPLSVASGREGVTAVEQSHLHATWISSGSQEPTLIMTRTVTLGARQWLQGFWIDWPALRAQLLEVAGTMLPGASLVPTTDRSSDDPASLGRRLAAIPVELVVPQSSAAVLPRWTPMRSAMALTWIAGVGGVLAIGFVLRASIELAERRGRFVSAVTHELRTPLTTFCLYSQMLDEGMVSDPAMQRTYFHTLRGESQRLARIVESVLDYARLGPRQPGESRTQMKVGELIDQCVGSLAARCEQSKMQLVIERGGDMEQVLTTDAASVERVLFNLVDNACKYASKASDRRVHVSAVAVANSLNITVRDHGPGIQTVDRKRVFRPFVRGAVHSDGAISGLGLGLALAKGLANQLGGDLRLGRAEDGAEFALSLPVGARVRGAG